MTETLRSWALSLWYFARHKYFVFEAGLLTGAPLWRLVVHDWSKLMPSQFGAYARHYHSLRPRDSRSAEAYRRAWHAHIHLSPHHWEHWVEVRHGGGVVALEMPYDFVREMVADWAGAGRAMHGRWDLVEWYGGHYAEMLLHPMTREHVRCIIDEWSRRSALTWPSR